MNLMTFSKEGRPCSVFFDIKDKRIHNLKVTDGAFSDEPWTLNDDDKQAIIQNIADEIAFCLADFKMNGSRFDA